MIINYNGIRNVLFLFLLLQYDDDYNGVRDVLSLFLLLQHDDDDYDDVGNVDNFTGIMDDHKEDGDDDDNDDASERCCRAGRCPTRRGQG